MGRLRANFARLAYSMRNTHTAILYNYPGPEGPEPVREAKPVPDRTLVAPGHQARRLTQPLRRSRVNLRGYSSAATHDYYKEGYYG